MTTDLATPARAPTIRLRAVFIVFGAIAWALADLRSAANLYGIDWVQGTRAVLMGVDVLLAWAALKAVRNAHNACDVSVWDITSLLRVLVLLAAFLWFQWELDQHSRIAPSLPNKWRDRTLFLVGGGNVLCLAAAGGAGLSWRLTELRHWIGLVCSLCWIYLGWVYSAHPWL